MDLFYQGTLQDGIALAMRESKAVVCFVRDDGELSTTWENEYFNDNEFAQALSTQAVVLRLQAGSPEAGFLTSFCPVESFPTVVVINHGTLYEYITVGTPKPLFRIRLLAATCGNNLPLSENPLDTAAAESIEPTSTSSAPPVISSAPPVISSSPGQYQSPQNSRPSIPTAHELRDSVNKHVSKKDESEKPPTVKQQPPKEDQPQKPVTKNQNKGKAPQRPVKAESSRAIVPPHEKEKPQFSAPRGPPTQYRLQVRLFDGSSVRSNFSPTQTIGSDVRRWLDEQMADEQRPYNLKHILTPLPSRTLSFSEESQALRDLGIGSTANLAMVPVQTYTSAYASAGSLPVRGVSAVYNMVSSAAGAATGLVGSLLGYGSNPAPNESNASDTAPAPSPATTQRTRPSGLNIRTLRDQQNDRDDRQFYNGNQLNFEPRSQDSKND
ncbi:hypothetical protein N7495_009501 [Penicillium taxi]|uniref:uncharacterized protein n=1 Tax=Penicillium taxi TaxID=168475 RepID=UPI00254513EC|nr:uncharacterized protein N7495_009501 [Penicillium taxi]KAJ5884991.1 hypothetical protein N7495_009501 [Penicillium taxi]